MLLPLQCIFVRSYLNFDTECKTIVDIHKINYFIPEYLSWVFIKMYEKCYKHKRNNNIFITSLPVNLLVVEQEFQNIQNSGLSQWELRLEISRQDVAYSKQCCVLNILKTE